jgi:hypothetical protein
VEFGQDPDHVSAQNNGSAGVWMPTNLPGPISMSNGDVLQVTFASLPGYLFRNPMVSAEIGWEYTFPFPNVGAVSEPIDYTGATPLQGPQTEISPSFYSGGCTGIYAQFDICSTTIFSRQLTGENGYDSFRVNFTLNGVVTQPLIVDYVSFNLTSSGPAAPELATWAMLLIGFVGVGAVGRRYAKPSWSLALPAELLIE